ncbi:MAG: manganese efflux pump MntP family protein [Deltaproteobacteria bacterium]
MYLPEVILIAVGLSFDTFAVSVSSGLCIKDIKFLQAVRVAIVLAVFQAIMPLIGWLGGIQIEKYLSRFDHWIAFGLLSVLGIKMIIESLKNEENKKLNPLIPKVLILMALATSIDAFVVGLSFAFIRTNILLAAIIIGFVTFIFSMIGMLAGKKISGKFGTKMEILGGLILIGIGIKVLLSHI